jgi:hypothetical protein
MMIKFSADTTQYELSATTVYGTNLQIYYMRIKNAIAKQRYRILHVTFASVRLPNFSKASLRLSSVVDQDRFPTKQL